MGKSGINLVCFQLENDEVVEEESAVLKDSIETELSRNLEERDPWMARKEDGVKEV